MPNWSWLMPSIWTPWRPPARRGPLLLRVMAFGILMGGFSVQVVAAQECRLMPSSRNQVVSVGVAGDLTLQFAATPACLAKSGRLQLVPDDELTYQFVTQPRLTVGESGKVAKASGVILKPRESHRQDAIIRAIIEWDESEGASDTIHFRFSPLAPNDVVLTPRSIGAPQLGKPFAVEVTASVARESGTFALAEYPIHLDGVVPSLQLRTDKNGIARFDNLVLNGKVGERTLDVRAATPLARPFSFTVPVGPGPVHAIQVQRRPPETVQVGTPMSIQATLSDEFGNPLPQVETYLTFRGASGLSTQKQSKASSNASGAVAFSEGYLGKPGELVATLSAGPVSVDMKLRAVTGPPAGIRVIKDVSPRLVADSVLSIGPRVLVVDTANNPVPGVVVTAQLCTPLPPAPTAEFELRNVRTLADSVARIEKVAKETIQQLQGHTTQLCRKDWRTSAEGTYRPSLRGTTNQATGEDGVAAFNDLAMLGPKDDYVLHFSVLGDSKPLTVFSGVMSYDPSDAYDRNFVIVSAIKGISGPEAPDEFLDLRFRVRFGRSVNVLLQSDLPLARANVADTLNSRPPQRRLYEASAMLNFHSLLGLWHAEVDRLTAAPAREPFGGVQLRIFNTVPYAGVQVGTVELAKSPFQGSYFSLGYLVPIDTTTVSLGQSNFSPASRNVLVDAFLRGEKLSILEHLNIRVTMMIPWQRDRRPVTRIVLAVPIGGLITY